MSTVKRAYVYRFYPTDEQKQILARTFGCVRYTYNWALRLSIDSYQQTGQGLSYTQMSVQLTTLKHQPQAAFLRGVRTSLSSRSDTMRKLRNLPDPPSVSAMGSPRLPKWTPLWISAGRVRFQKGPPPPP